jgi:hypothetical protein
MLRKLDASSDLFAKSLGLASTTGNEITAAPLLTQLLRAELIKKKFAGDKIEDGKKSVLWMDTTMVRGGGTSRVRKGIFLGIFTPSKQVAFSGGTVVGYSLFENSGLVRFSGVESDYRPFSKAVDLPNKCP